MTNDPNGVMVQKADTPIELILRAKGYEDHRFSIIPSQDKRFDKAMVALKASSPSKPKPRDRDRDPKPTKQETPPKPEVKTTGAEPADDSGGGSDLKNPFGKK